MSSATSRRKFTPYYGRAHYPGPVFQPRKKPSSNFNWRKRLRKVNAFARRSCRSRAAGSAPVPFRHIPSSLYERNHRKADYVAQLSKVLSLYDGDVGSGNKTMSGLSQGKATLPVPVTFTHPQRHEADRNNRDNTSVNEDHESNALRQIIDEELNGVTNLISDSCNDDPGYASKSSELHNNGSGQKYTSSEGDVEYILVINKGDGQDFRAHRMVQGEEMQNEEYYGDIL